MYSCNVCKDAGKLAAKGSPTPIPCSSCSASDTLLFDDPQVYSTDSGIDARITGAEYKRFFAPNAPELITGMVLVTDLPTRQQQ